MKIERFVSCDRQECRFGRHVWSVARLIQLSRKLPILRIPLDHLYVYYTYPQLTLRDTAMHMKTVLNADLRYPIILDEDGALMDGRHRIMKALLEGRKSIKAVRFPVNPTPDRIDKARG